MTDEQRLALANAIVSGDMQIISTVAITISNQLLQKQTLQQIKDTMPPGGLNSKNAQ